MRRIVMDDFGTWLMGELEKRQLSQSDLSRLSGLSQGTISNIISGKRGRGSESLSAIARALKIPREEIYRAAHLLPPRSIKDVLIDRIIHALETLPPEEKEELLEYIELKRKQLERKKPPSK